MVIFFLTLFCIVGYTYLGYGVLLWAIVKVKGSAINPNIYKTDETPAVTHIIAAFNEADYIAEKIENALSLDYPNGLYEVWIVTDGSNDATPEIVKKYPSVRLFHQSERMGKIHAVNRIMPLVKTPIVVYSDANTTINRQAIRNITRHYSDPMVGCVSGEKRIKSDTTDDAASSGEGIYWKYESFLKKLDYQLYSVVGAAGELFSVRTSLFESVKTDTLIEDFYLSLSIAQKGYKIAYEPDSYAMEQSSASVAEESKRKVRIAAGGIQAILMLLPLFNIFKYRWLSFQYVSHRVLRWTLAPLALPLIFLVNLTLLDQLLFQLIFAAQVLFYGMALLGQYFQKKSIKVKVLFVPFYFTFMNVSVFQGFARYLKGSQSILWDKAARKK